MKDEYEFYNHEKEVMNNLVVMCINTCEKEAGLSSLEILADFKVLSNLDVWIADTRATVHTTPYSVGIISLCETDSRDSVTVDNSNKMESVAIGNIPGTITNKIDYPLMSVTLKEVVHILLSRFNLLSLTRLISE